MLYHLVRRCDKMWKTTCHNLSHDVTRKKMHRTQDATSCDAPMQNGQQDHLMVGAFLTPTNSILLCTVHLLASPGPPIPLEDADRCGKLLEHAPSFRVWIKNGLQENSCEVAASSQHPLPSGLQKPSARMPCNACNGSASAGQSTLRCELFPRQKQNGDSVTPGRYGRRRPEGVVHGDGGRKRVDRRGLRGVWEQQFPHNPIPNIGLSSFPRLFCHLPGAPLTPPSGGRPRRPGLRGLLLGMPVETIPLGTFCCRSFYRDARTAPARGVGMGGQELLEPDQRRRIPMLWQALFGPNPQHLLASSINLGTAESGKELLGIQFLAPGTKIV
eukprot:gene14980-biopygen11184